MSPNVVYERGSQGEVRVCPCVVINVVGVYTRDNAVDGNDGRKFVSGKKCNHLSIHRMCDARVPQSSTIVCFALDGTDYTTCLEVPANNKSLHIIVMEGTSEGG